MKKLKTNKSILSRIKVTGKGKLVKRATGQSHFNTKDSGKRGRIKHRKLNVKTVDIKSFKQFLPYHK